MKTVYDYKETLTAIQTIASQAHIAGGAPRDTITGKPIRDVDVFLPDTGDNIKKVAALLRSHFHYVQVGQFENYEGFSEPAMTCVAKFEKWDETIPICLIGLKEYAADPWANIDRFDFGICMVAYAGREIIRDSRFSDDLEAQTFTLCRADNERQLIYSLSRYEKITAERYAGWGLVIPDEFRSLAAEREFRKSFYRDDNKGGWVRRGPQPKLRAVA